MTKIILDEMNVCSNGKLKVNLHHMFTYPDINPALISLGPLQVHWYGIMYLIGFGCGWWLGRIRASRPGSGWKSEHVDDLVFYGALGVILGGRIGYVLFYDFDRFLDNPLILFFITQGGMSFHGGLLGVLAAMWVFARRQKIGFFKLMDFVAPLVPIGLGTGRLGNFINGELWGAPGSVPWAMRVPCERFVELCTYKLRLPPGTEFTPPLHPSQLYEAALEGAALFLLLWIYSAKPRPVMAVSAMFLMGYGIFRFAVEFVRVPDAHLGYLALGWVTMGQLLTLPMLIGGIVLFILAYRKQQTV